MNRPSYKELWLYECKDRDEQLQWIRNAVNGNAKFCNSEPPYSEEEELARKIMQMHARIAELEAAQRWHVVKECNDVATPIDVALRKRIAELEGKIDQLTAHDATERQDDKWIPVSERLPEAYEKVIALAKDCMNVDWVLPKELREVGKGAFARLYSVTHWMPLPKPPEVQE